jgi:hypothetical protein
VFVFTATNISDEHRDVSITQTWTEITLRANKKKKNLGEHLTVFVDDCGTLMMIMTLMIIS